MANKFQIKRTTTSGLLPNTTNSGNTSYIAAGELAINLTDEKMVSSNGSATFEIGANLTNLSVANQITVIEKLQIGDHGVAGFDFGALALVEADGNKNSYLQFVMQNANTGEFVSSDFVAVSDDGDDTTNYADFGINGSNYAGPEYTLSGPHDGYLYTSNGHLLLGSIAAKDIIFHSAGANTEHELARISTSGQLRIGNTTANTLISPEFIIASNLEIRDTATINTISITIGNSSINTIISDDELDLGGWIIANGSVGTAGQVLKSGGIGANVYWGAAATGGTGTPGGTDTQVQFNDGDAFGGDAGLTYNKTTDALSVAGSVLIGANVIANTSALLIGNSSVNTIITSTTFNGNTITANAVNFGTANVTALNVGANVSANATTLFVGNSSVNTTISSATIKLGGNLIANGSNGVAGYVLTTSNTGNVYWYSPLEPVGSITHDMTGHLDRTDSTLSVNNATRTVTWTPTTTSTVYYRGKKLEISSAKTFTFNDTDGGHYINLNPDTLELYDNGATAGIRDNILVTYVFWDATNNEAIIFGDERHGSNRDVEWHYANHRNLGAVWRSGGGLTYTLDSDTAVSLAVGTPLILADEDLEHNITHAASPNGYYQQVLSGAAVLPVLYRNGTSYSQVAGNTVPWLFGTTLAQYNPLVGNSGSLAQADEGEYISYWLVATNDMQNPVKLIVGNFSHATLDDALGEEIADIGLYFPEFAVMYHIILQTSTAFTGNTSRVKISQVRRVAANALARQTISSGSHGELTGRGDADQHTIASITGLQTIIDGLGTMSTQDANNVTISGGSANLTTLTIGADVSVNSTAFDVGNTTITTTNLTLGGQLTANGGVGTAGQVLKSGGSGNTYWDTVTSGGGTPGGANTTIQYNDSGVFGGSLGFTFDETTNTVSVANTVSTVNLSVSNTISTSNLAVSGVFTLATDSIEVGNTSVNTAITNTDFTKNGVSIVPFGQQTIWIPAVAMYTPTTNGAAAGSIELPTNDVQLKTLDFDTTTQEFAQFAIQMPKSWDLSTLVARFVWSHASTTTNFGVAWQIQAYAFADNTALDTAFGTAVVVTDTGGTTNNLYLSPETGNITVGGTPSPEEHVIFRVARVPANAGDTMAIDARLHGVRIHYTTNAASDT